VQNLARNLRLAWVALASLGVGCDGFIGEVTVNRKTNPAIAVSHPDYVTIRPVSTTSWPGAVAATLYDRTFFFRESERILDLRHLDLRTATVESRGSRGGPWVVSIQTTSAGARLLGAWTSANIGKPLGVFLNRRLISAPIVNSPITDVIILDGDFTQAQAEAVAKCLHRGGTA
jgi:preprotein translocase subunit SecD